MMPNLLTKAGGLWPELYQAGTWLYWQCTDFVIHSAGLMGVTYRDANALLFFVLWPLVTLTLTTWVLWQALQLHKTRP